MTTYTNGFVVAAAAPGTPDSGDLWLDTVNNLWKRWNGSAWTALAGSGTPPPNASSYENWTALIPGGQPPSAQTNWGTAVAFQSARYFGITKSSTGAQNASITFDVTLSAGTWTLGLYYQAAADRGIFTVAVDGSTVGTIDGYAASGTASHATLTGITVAAGGHHTVTLTMAAKNASSSSYVGDVSAIEFVRTA